MRKTIGGMLATTVLLAALPAAAATKFERYELPNGLKVVLHEDRTLPTVVVDVDYHVGSKNEEPGRTGFAHLFEHLMFGGSKHASQPYDFYTEPAGATNNAFTSADNTNYHVQLPSHQLELGLWLEADRMGFFGEALAVEPFEAQRAVVKNEKRQRYDNAPYGSKYEEMFKRLFHEHPYRWSVIGSMDDLDAAELSDVKAFFDKYYAPNNATLVVAGDFDSRQAKAWIDKYFGPLKRGPEIMRPFSSDKPLAGVARATIKDNVQQPAVLMGYRTAKLGDADSYPLDLLAAILGGGRSSRLYKSLVIEQKLAQDVDVSHWSQEHHGIFWLEAVAAPGISAEKLEKAIDGAIGQIRRELVSDTERTKAINQQIASQVFEHEDLMDRTVALAMAETFFNDPAWIDRQALRYQSQSRADILRAAQQYLKPDARVILTYVPAEKEGAK